MKVYYDTNILICYFNWRYLNEDIDKNLLDIFERGLSGEYEINISYLSLIELEAYFSNKKITKKMIRTILKDIKNAKDISFIEVIDMDNLYYQKITPYLINNIDLSDAMHIRIAQDCGCKYFITNDMKLLENSIYLVDNKIFDIGFYVINIDDFKKILNKETSDKTFYEAEKLENLILNHYISKRSNSITVIDRDFFDNDAIFTQNGKKYAIDFKFNTKSKIPASTIKEIIERNLNKFDKTILVSTLGFSNDAKELAEKNKEKIELKLLSDFFNEFSTSMMNFQLLRFPALKRIPSEKDKLKELWENLQNEKVNNKGSKLEDWTGCMLNCINGFKIVNRDIRTDVEEIDFIISNESRDQFWLKRNDPILVECKNWSKPVGSGEIKKFASTLEDKNLKDGIFITMNGITGNEYKDAYREIKNKLIKGYCIMVLDKNDMINITECIHPTDVLKEKYYDLYR